MNFLQIFSVDVCVDFRRRDIGMTEHFLHGPQVRPSFEKMRRE